MSQSWYTQLLNELQNNQDISPDPDRIAIDFIRRKIISVEDYNMVDNESGQAKKWKKLHEVLAKKDANAVVEALLSCAEDHGWFPARDYILKAKSQA